MCGVAGLVGHSPMGKSRDECLLIVRSMTDSMRHRGPDDEGAVVVSQEPLAVLGHRRLSIIDISAAGHQPMTDADGNWVTYNGEIYNYRELRHQLIDLGHHFATNSDTEVLLRAYAQWGDEVVTRLRGIFAFGLWDARRKRLLLGRDHMGVKPMYYSLAGQTLLFASEVRALLATGLISRKLDMRAAQSYLAYGSVQDPYTLVRGINSLEPGHLAILQDGKLTIRSYWRIEQKSLRSGSLEAAMPEVKHKLEEAVASQLVADVPIGAFLSGGIDSTAIAALAQRALSQPVRTLSIAFDEAEYDEREFARLASRHIGSDHHELVLRGADFRNHLPLALAAFDQPSADGLNTYFVSKLAREAGLTVALSGVGGDELFGGYGEYSHVRRVRTWSRRLRRVPRMMRRFAARGMRAWQHPVGHRIVDLLDSRDDPYFLSRRLFAPAQAAELFHPDVPSGTSWYPERFTRLSREAAGFDAVAGASAMELQTYMLSTLLRDTDQMAMAHALEVRVPLIDPELVALVFSLPGSWRLKEGVPKPLLTNALGDAIPKDCAYRPKRGFELPYQRWLRESLKTDIERSFTAATEADAWPFRPDQLRNLWSGFAEGRLGWSRIWSIFALRDWLHRHQIGP
jgi:asparagine synthase (glutamine-hydrolysing)